MMMQLATIYFYTGCAKTGGIWAAGDSLYYALNLDHFYRAPPQLLSSLFGTNLFRLMTWGVHVWQIGFPLVLVGLVARFQIREGFGPGRGWRRHATRLLWMLVGFGALGVTVVALPVHYEPMRGGPSTVIGKPTTGCTNDATFTVSSSMLSTKALMKYRSSASCQVRLALDAI